MTKRTKAIAAPRTAKARKAAAPNAAQAVAGAVAPSEPSEPSDAPPPPQRRPDRLIPLALSKALVPVIAPALRERGVRLARLAQEWDAVVGPLLAEGSIPIRLSRDPDGENATLTVKVRPGGLALELQHLSAQALEKINGFFGFQAVTRLRIVQGHVPPRRRPPRPTPRALPPEQDRALQAQAATVRDDRLRQALIALGRAVLSRP